MAFTNTTTYQLSPNGGAPLAKQYSVTANAREDLQVPIPASGCTDLEVETSLTVANLAQLVWQCDRELTIKTNSDSAPDQTFTLPAGLVQEWVDGGIFSNPLTTDVTAYYLTAGSGTVESTFYQYAPFNA